MAEGFDARAVAVFKQILKLDPDRLDAYEPLAELYERMGLNAEALAALQTAADGYHRQGKKSEALELLRKMANADPSNTRSRIKVAELLRQEGKPADAAAEYQLAADELERQGDFEAVGQRLPAHARSRRPQRARVRRRSHRISPRAARSPRRSRSPSAHSSSTMATRTATSSSATCSSAPSAARIRSASGARSPICIASAATRAARARSCSAYAGLVELGSRHADARRARPRRAARRRSERCCSTRSSPTPTTRPSSRSTSAASSRSAPDASLSGVGRAIDPGATLSSSQRVPSGPISAADDGEELLLEDVREPEPVSASDLEQLLAEASVYLRYGKRDKAIAHLQRVIEAQPDHRVALEKLGEAYAESGEHTRAVGMWQRAATRAHAEGDAEALRVLRGRIAVLDESAASQLPVARTRSRAERTGRARRGPAPARAAPASTAGADLDELVLDDDDEFLDDIALDDDRGEPALEIADDELESRRAEATSPTSSSTSSRRSRSTSRRTTTRWSSSPASAPAPPPAQSAPAPASEQLRKQQILDDLEEADFYMQQGLHDEAEAIYRRMLDVAPESPARAAEARRDRGGASR